MTVFKRRSTMRFSLPTLLACPAIAAVILAAFYPPLQTTVTVDLGLKTASEANDAANTALHLLPLWAAEQDDCDLDWLSKHVAIRANDDRCLHVTVTGAPYAARRIRETATELGEYLVDVLDQRTGQQELVQLLQDARDTIAEDHAHPDLAKQLADRVEHKLQEAREKLENTPTPKIDSTATSRTLQAR